jgi:hypothetical protein
VIDKALKRLRPGAEWSVDGDTYEGIQWLDAEQSVPSFEEVSDEIEKIREELQRTQYQRLRAREYPPLSDLADALYWQAQGDNEPMARYVAACEVVKAKYPKGGNDA